MIKQAPENRINIGFFTHLICCTPHVQSLVRLISSACVGSSTSETECASQKRLTGIFFPSQLPLRELELKKQMISAF